MRVRYTTTDPRYARRSPTVGCCVSGTVPDCRQLQTGSRLTWPGQLSVDRRRGNYRGVPAVRALRLLKIYTKRRNACADRDERWSAPEYEYPSTLALGKRLTRLQLRRAGMYQVSTSKHGYCVRTTKYLRYYSRLLEGVTPAVASAYVITPVHPKLQRIDLHGDTT